MNKHLLTSLLTLALAPAYSAEPSQSAISVQQNAQRLCQQQRTDICVKKLCQTKDDKNCVKICEITVENECRQAGE